MSGNPVNSSFAKNLIKHTRWRVPQKKNKFKQNIFLLEKSYSGQKEIKQ